MLLNNEAKAKQIELEAPKVAYVKQIINDEESLSINEVARLLSSKNGCMIKFSSLFEFLRQSNCLMIDKEPTKKNKPYSRLVINGWGVIKANKVNDKLYN